MCLPGERDDFFGNPRNPLRTVALYGRLNLTLESTQRLIRLIRPLVPGFQVTLIPRCFIVTELAIFDTLRLHLRLVRALQIAGGHQECVIHSRACDSLQVGRLQVLNRGVHLDFEVLRWSKLVEIGVHKTILKQSPTERLLRLRTATTPHKQQQLPKFRVTPHRVRLTAVEGIQKRLTRCFRGLEVASQQHKNLPRSQTHFNSRAGADEYIIDEKTDFTTSLLFTRRMIQLFSTRTRKACRPKYFIPVRGSKLLSPKKDKNGLKGSGFFLCINFSETSKYVSWL